MVTRQFNVTKISYFDVIMVYLIRKCKAVLNLMLEPLICKCRVLTE